MARLCAYCTRRATADEHPISRWVTESVLARDPHAIGIASQHEQYGSWPGRYAEFTIRVCAECEKWLSQSEEAKPHLEAMLHRDSTEIPLESHELLALWITKCSAGQDFYQPASKRILSRSEMQSIGEHQRPLPSWEIRVGDARDHSASFGGYWPESAIVPHVLDPSGKPVQADSPRGHLYRGYTLTTVVKHLVLQVRGHTLPAGIEVGWTAPDEHLYDLWPPTGRPLGWPPPEPFGMNGVWQPKRLV